VADDCTGRNVEDAVPCPEFTDRGTPAVIVTFAEDFLEVPVKQLADTLCGFIRLYHDIFP
jgi:hypothetical protein